MRQSGSPQGLIPQPPRSRQASVPKATMSLHEGTCFTLLVQLQAHPKGSLSQPSRGPTSKCVHDNGVPQGMRAIANKTRARKNVTPSITPTPRYRPHTHSFNSKHNPVAFSLESAAELDNTTSLYRLGKAKPKEKERKETTRQRFGAVLGPPMRSNRPDLNQDPITLLPRH